MMNLINLDPALEVALLGGLLACVPVAWVARRTRHQGVHGWPAWQKSLTVLALFLTLDLVVFGAFTRLTDSGLGCPDWPGCYGQTSPLGAQAEITAAQTLRPTGPVTHDKAWIEMLHRYLATAVGALITGLMVMAWVYRKQVGALSPWWATATFVWVCAQGAFGALTVTLKLQPIVVTGHLIGALLGVALLTAQVRAQEAQGLRAWSQTGVPRGWATSALRRWGWAMLGLVSVQIALGGWVSTNYAVLVCSEVPLCQGQWWPHMDFASAFRLMRPLGEDGLGGTITLPALTAIHMAHRCMAVVVLLALWAYGWRLRRWHSQFQRPWQREGAILWALALWQLASGLSNVILGWPLAAALAHTLGAALLIWRLTHLLVCPEPARQGSTAAARAQQGLHAGVAHISAP